jgi:hypothetical protein
VKAKLIALSVALVVIVGAAAGLGGYSLGVKEGRAQAAETRSAFLAARGLGNGPQGAGLSRQGDPGMLSAAAGAQPGAPINTANLAMGQVKQVDGNTVQLSTANEVLTVAVGEQTRIQKMMEGDLSDVSAGERIIVQGARKSDGVFAAQIIQIGGGISLGNPPLAPQEAAPK